MRNIAVIDSGPLIALFDVHDAHHQRVRSFLDGFRGQLFTTSAVLTEVTHLLGFHVNAQLDFLRWIADGAVELVDMERSDLFEICRMTEKYSDVPMDFADASLMLIAEKLNIPNVLSIDQDFAIYRTSKKQFLTNLLDAE